MASSSYRASNVLQRVLASPVGGFLLRGWLEKPILKLLQNWYFPVSRLWAAARTANGDVDAFFAAVPMAAEEKERERIQQLLNSFEEKRQQISQTEQLRP